MHEMTLDINTIEKTLFLGEGNFSFSANLVRILGQESLSNVWSSCFESDESKKELNEQNIEANDIKLNNITFLKSRGCHVLAGVDAENLDSDPRLSGKLFSKIIFMFPHVGGKMKINRNRKLLLNVISSCRKMIEDDGLIVITLCRGQGGTPGDTVQRSPSDHWRLVDMCHEADCILTGVETFPHKQFLDYHQVGYRGLYKGFNVDGAVVHSIKKREPRIFHCIGHSTSSGKMECQDDFRDKSLYPPHHVHHLSFWLPPSFASIEPNHIDNIMSKTGAGCVVTRCKTIQMYKDENSGKRSQTIEMEFCDLTRPLGHTRALHLLINIIGKSFENTYGLDRR